MPKKTNVGEPQITVSQIPTAYLTSLISKRLKTMSTQPSNGGPQGDYTRCEKGAPI